MADGLRAERFEHLVREWAGRVRNLAFRMLGSGAEADDATQEVFVRLWERIEAYDPARPFQPWIYSVATRSILNRIRGERTRARKHAEAPPSAPPETTEAAVERREREAAVHEGLQRIDGDARALLAMHYYGGLTQEEIAAVLGAPRSTVRSRIGRALDALRDSLRGARHFALLPGLEETMRGTPPLPADGGLVASLLKIAAPAAGAAAAAAGISIVGGIIVTKKLVIAAAILAALVGGGGFLAGRVLRGAPASEATDAAPAESARLVEENRRLRAELAARGPAAPRLAAAAPSGPPSARTSRAPTGEPAAAEPEPAPKEGGLDWSRFSRLFAENAGKLAAAMAAHDGDGDGKLDPADEAALLAVFAEYMRVCVDARALSPHPFFDDHVLPDLAVAIFGDSLGLSADRKKALEESARKALRARKDLLDLDRAGPLEAFGEREKISAEVLSAAGEGLDGASRERLKALEPLARAMLLGSQSEVRIGIQSGTPGDPVSAKVLAEWKEAYGLDDRQADSARPLADRFARDAGDALKRRGIDAAGAAASEAQKEEARREVLRLGVLAEREILSGLSAPQRAAAQKKPPRIVLIEPGDGVQRSTTNAGGL